jgi:hypothetical protein
LLTIQHVIDPATDLIAQPDFIQDYLHGLPAAWDETRVVAGAPGELAVLARRQGRTWYLSGINGEKMAKTIQVPLAFLAAPAEVSLITDEAMPHEFAHRTFTARPGAASRLASRSNDRQRPLIFTAQQIY